MVYNTAIFAHGFAGIGSAEKLSAGRSVAVVAGESLGIFKDSPVNGTSSTVLRPMSDS